MRKRVYLLWLFPAGVIAVFAMTSSWIAIGVVGVLAVLFLLGVGVWAEGGFTQFDLGVLRRRESWRLRKR
jgi:hypothetical protein